VGFGDDVDRWVGSARPGWALAPRPSPSRRLSVPARSTATAFSSWITVTSPWGTSIDSMMRAIRLMFSA